MGGCRRGNFRGYLDDLQEANAEQKAQAFDAVKRGDTARILEILRAFPGLLKQASDEGHHANVLIAILYEIHTTRNQQIRVNLIELINKIIAENRENIDLTFVDADRNTALHRVFWYAITSENAETSQALTEIGIRLLELIKNSTHFRQILALKNKYNESFLQNIYINNSTVRLTEANRRFLPAVQGQVGGLLAPYKRAQADNLVEIPNFDFNAQSFKARLEESLTDTITYTLMDTPYILAKEGHTLNQSTWATLNPKQDPFSRAPYNDSELMPNKHIAKAIELFNQHQDNEPELARQLTRYFDAQSQAETIDDQFVSNPDVLTNDIKQLVMSYNLQFNRQQANDSDEELSSDLDDNPLLDQEERQNEHPVQNPFTQDKIKILRILAVLQANIRDKKEGRETWYTNNTDTKLAKLDAVTHWLERNELNSESQAIVLGLIRDICAMTRNPLGIFKPHSQAEFEIMAARSLLNMERVEGVQFNSEELSSLGNPDRSRTNRLIERFISETVSQEENLPIYG